MRGNRLNQPPKAAPNPSTSPQQGRSAATESRARTQAAMVGTIESRSLTSKIMKATHPLHGELTVERQAKAENENQLTFNLTLVQPNGETIEDSHEMFVTRSARNYPNQSAVGYNYIDLDEGFQGKGVGYVLHAAAAEAAVELDARLLVIDDVSTDAMFGFCRQTGMKENFNSYSLSPPLAEEVFKNKAAFRGWTLS